MNPLRCVFSHMLMSVYLIAHIYTCQLYEAALVCIKCVLESGEISDLAQLYEEVGGDVNAKLKQLVGQV